MQLDDNKLVAAFADRTQKFANLVKERAIVYNDKAALGETKLRRYCA